jgi:hypothetical protein
LVIYRQSPMRHSVPNGGSQEVNSDLTGAALGGKSSKDEIGVTTNFSMAHTGQSSFFRGTQGIYCLLLLYLCEFYLPRLA